MLIYKNKYKNMKTKIISILMLLTLSLSAFAADGKEATIVSLDSTKTNIIKILTDKEFSSSDLKLNSEAKIFKDLNLDKVTIDSTNKKKLDVTLKQELKANTSYSFLSVYWIDGNMDFSLWNDISWIDIENSATDENVASIFIKSPKEIVITFKKDITPSDDLEVKLLRQLKISDILIDSDNDKQINILLKDNLEDSSNYILMLFQVSTKEWVKTTFLNWIYDFSTNDSLQDQKITNLTKENVLKKVALNAAETPDTGTSTNILLILTFIMSSLIFFRRKKA